MKVVIEKADGSKRTVPVLPKTQVAFERHFGMGLGAMASENRLEHIYWLAWDAEHTAGHVVKPFDGWLEDVVAVDLEDDAAPLEAPRP